MELFSETPICEELEGLSMEEAKNRLEKLTFSKFIKTKNVQNFIFTSCKNPRLPTMRYVYIYYLFNKIGDYIGDTKISDIFQELTNANTDTILNIREIYAICDNLTTYTQCSICLAIECITRGQHTNFLWDILRDGVISSSKFYNAVKQQSFSKKLFDPWPIENNYYVASPLAFGLRCENAIKTAISEFVCKKKNVLCDMGFMMSPKDGILGVSLDMCANASTIKDDIIEFKADTELYEIKCRFKYKFSKTECDQSYKRYKELYDKPCKQTLIKFIHSINKPAIEYVPPGKLPTKNDYLLTFDSDWNLNQKRKRNITSCHKNLLECMKANQYVTSRAIIFTDPSESDGKIDIKAKLDLDVFINPDHSYFYQVLLQYKVVTNYIQYHSPSQLGRLKNYIVSGFFRERSHADPILCTIGESGTLDSSVEIPVFIIITPVYIPNSVAVDSLQRAAKFWSSCAETEFKNPPWVSSSLFADGDLTP
ncbi:deoxyribonuclease [Vespertilionid gammaherpesvirus 1]|uniref:Deoxyribonuclease n=1 Tax=Vespertilionid gammaherpesvirus 1 TaxID=2560830 RepID=A0A0X9WYX5_9GAMA|nr:deoxyribonuclease [Myotis gammaherpesvirus 8]AMA67393.1 deoxyribonuclease [Vespertilionid gammaherpesvirus 1]